ncbi:MAG TPA: response regulator transcription factor [Bacteroidales bacterium]|nr:response regulator transcription factor [Bacteroidales bacterium]
MNQINIIIVDDHPMVRDGILSMLKSDSTLHVIGEAADSHELFQLLSKTKPHILLLDISLPGVSGIEICQKITETEPDIRCIMLSMYLKEEFIFSALKAGTKGYIPKTAQKNELIEAIHTVAKGKEYFSPALSDIILKSYIRRARNNNEPTKEKELTKRELEILKLVALGKSNHTIAEELFIGIRTVESHKTHILQKLNLKNNVDLVHFAIKHGIIQLSQ